MGIAFEEKKKIIIPVFTGGSLSSIASLTQAAPRARIQVQCVEYAAPDHRFSGSDAGQYNLFRYHAHVCDEKTELYYLKSRYYTL